MVCYKTGEKGETKYGTLVGVVSGNSPRVGTFFTRVSAYAGYIERNGTERNCLLYGFLNTIIVFSLYGFVT